MEEHVLDAVQRLKDSEFGLTGIKIELEAVFGRNDYSTYCSVSSDCNFYSNDCGYCGGNQRVECGRCDGDGDITCDNCDGDCEVECEPCHGRGQRRRLADNEMVTHRACRGTGQIQCEQCSGNGEVSCDSCDGSGEIACDDCADSDTSCTGDHLHGGSMVTFNDYFLSRLVPLGLAEESDDGYTIRGSTLARKYRPIGALKYSKFYVDHSVDTECTFTLSVEDDPTVVLKLPEIVRAFSSIKTIIGNDIDVRGAGMHMALLNSAGAIYPYDSFDEQRFRNFQRSMHLLMPALYFLGSVDDSSRGLHYRQPYVNSPNHGGKYWAVNYTGGALEFRIFETCYQRPEAILDNIVVMANCMKHWTREYTAHGLSRITRRIKFGVDTSNKLERFYRNKTHFDLLFAGLDYLKPAYYSVEELCTMRSFKVTPATLDTFTRELNAEIDRQYLEYCERHDKLMSVERTRTITQLAKARKIRLNTRNTGVIDALILETDTRLNQLYQKIEKATFKRKLLERNQEGQYTLEEA